MTHKAIRHKGQDFRSLSPKKKKKKCTYKFDNRSIHLNIKANKTRLFMSSCIFFKQR